MLNKIINFSLHNRLLIIVIAVLLSATGIYTASRMEVDVFPDLNAPTVVVMTEAPGMATEEVERTVTFVIETALIGSPVEGGFDNVPLLSLSKPPSTGLPMCAGYGRRRPTDFQLYG